MAKIVKNALDLGYGFNVKSAGPIDSRMKIHDTKSLTENLGTPDAPAYAGMLVSVLNEDAVYLLKYDTAHPSETDPKPLDPKNKSNWVKLLNKTEVKWDDIDDGTIPQNKIPLLDLDKIPLLTLDKIPQGALERCVIIATVEELVPSLYPDTVQFGDVVKVNSTGEMYFVRNSGTEEKPEVTFEVFKAGSASTVPWSGVEGKPTYFNKISDNSGKIVTASTQDDTLKIVGDNTWINTVVTNPEKAETLTIYHKDVARAPEGTGTTSLDYGGKVTVLTSVLNDDKGHITGSTNTTISLPGKLSAYSVISGDTGSASAEKSGDAIHFIGGNTIETKAVNNTGNITDTLTIDHSAVKRTDPEVGRPTKGYGDNFTAVESVGTNTEGHVTAVTTNTITLPSKQPAYTKLSDGSKTASAETANEEILFSGGTKISTTVASGNGKDTVTIAHTGSKAIQNTDQPQSPGHNSTFTAIKAITCDDLGHVSTYTPTTVTIPAETELSLAGEQNNQFISNVSVGDHTITLASANETSLSISDEAGTSGWYSSFKQSGSSNHTVVLTKTKPGISDVTGLSNELAKYLPLAGGDMDNNSSIRWTDGDAVATINGNCGGGDSYLNLSATDVIKLDCLTTEMTGELSVNTIKPNTGYTINFPSGATMNILSVDGIDSNTGDTVNFPSGLNSDAEIRSSKGFFDDSDERLKNFTDDIDIDFDKIKAIPKKYYYWKDKENRGDKLQLGTSAQELMKIYPELVSEDKEGYLSVNYARLSVIALKAVDVLHEENEQLKERLRRIEEKLGM